MDTGGGTSEGAQPPAPWALLPLDILGVVLRFLPCLSDHVSMQSVCRWWRAAARLNRPPPPLPLLILSKFTFASFSPDGATTAVRRIPLPQEVAHDDVRCVGSFEGWLVGACPSKTCRYADGVCFLLNPLSQAVIRILSPCAFHFFGTIWNSVPISNGSGEVTYVIRAPEYSMSLCKVVLSCSPDSGSECIVAAISQTRAGPKLALWQPGMTSWCVCDGAGIISSNDIVFYQGNLYMLNNYTRHLYAFELGKHDDGMPVISRVERCMTEPLPLLPSNNRGWQQCRLVEWHGKLLVVIIYLDSFQASHKICSVDVLALDFSTNPYGCKEVKSLDGECIFISAYCSKSFPASQYDGVEDDRIYFINDEYRYRDGEDNNSFDGIIYNMRDATVGTFTVKGSRGSSVCPVWFFPSG